MIALNPDPLEHPECLYCNRFLSPSAIESNSPWNTPVLQSENFVVVPTLGHLVPGWLLLVPRKHYICMGALPSETLSELASVKDEAERLLLSLYRPPIKFEHGSCSYGKAGACVDHAHLHLVPMEQDLSNELNFLFSRRPVRSCGDLSVEYQLARPYLFYEDSAGLASIYEISVIPSQFMRMLVARRLGMLDRYDWRRYSGEQELQFFLRDLNTLKNSRQPHELFA